MNRPILLLFFWFLSTATSFGDAPWVSVSVSESEEADVLSRLESRGIPALGWSNAVVEVSAFEGLETIPLSRVAAQLSPSDPRWDPWLRSLAHWFQPSHGRTRIWVPAGQANVVERLIGPLPGPSAPETLAVSARLVTGWTVVSLTLMFCGLMVASGLRFGWPSLREVRRWAWVPLALVLLIGGGILTLGGQGPTTGEPAKATESWVQHRWFQETWPWGSRWEDYAPGRLWTYPSYEHHNGRLAEVETTLGAGSQDWKRALEASLDPHHAVRIFGSFLP